MRLPAETLLAHISSRDLKRLDFHTDPCICFCTYLCFFCIIISRLFFLNFISYPNMINMYVNYNNQNSFMMHEKATERSNGILS